MGKEGREQWEGKRRERNAQTWRGGDSCESQTPLTASGRERGKGTSGKGTEGREHPYREHIISTALNLNVYMRPWLGVCIRDQTI